MEANNNSSSDKINLHDLPQFKFEDLTNTSVLNTSQSDSSPNDSSILLSKEKDDKTDNNKIHLETKQPLSLITKLGYAIPAFSKMSCLLILNVNALIFYETKGASLLLISFFTALARCIELFLKPIIAFSSDNSNFKKGRRKPFMLFGCGFYCVFLVLIFSPPFKHMTPIATSLWFGVFYVLFFIADTICTIPYHALGPELSIDSKEREQLYLYVFAFQYIGVLLTSIGPVLIQKIVNHCDCSYCSDRTDSLDVAQCFLTCNSECGVTSNEKSLLYMCMIIGTLFVLSIIFLTTIVKEDKKSFNSHEKSYIVPTLYRMMMNKPFIKLLLPYVLDVLITQILATMLPFFITYIINPAKYCKDNDINLSFSQCSANSWLGITMFAFFVCSLFTVIGWHFYANAIGKKKAWQSYSAICLLSFSLFLFCGSGDTYLLTILAALVSIPASGAYLNDVFLTDTIDYDEFLTGKRNEGVYMVFSVFIPKIVGIAAQSIPLTIMSLMGFVSSNGGVVYKQPKGVLEFIRFYLIGVPVLLSIISFYLKSKYPIDEKKMSALTKTIVFQNLKIKEIKDNVNFYLIKNPVYGNEQIQIIPKTEVEKNTMFVAEHFLNEDYLQKLSKGDFKGVYKQKLFILIIWFAVLAVFSFVLGMTFKYLEITSLNLFPLFSLIIVTISISAIVINLIQLRVIYKCMKGDYEIDLDFMKLILYKVQNEVVDASNKNEGLIAEFVNLFHECKKNNN